MKTHIINEIEGGEAAYDADLINKIEKALGAHLDRGRKKKK